MLAHDSGVVHRIAIRCALLGPFFFCCGLFALAQVPVRDAPQTLPAGTAKLSGVVLIQDGAGMPRASVTLIDDRGRATTIMTDDAGLFTFSGVPAGTFELVAKVPTFLPAYYGQTKPGRPGMPLKLTDGQQLRDVRLTLVRGGVIAGTVMDPSGQPAYGASVQLYQRRFRSDGPWFAPVLSAPWAVDDLGQYRIHGLMPGEYVVMALPRFDYSASTDMSERLVSTFSPGVEQIEQATPVSVGPAEQRVGTDIRLVLGRRVKISGRVLGAQGAAAVWSDVFSIEGGYATTTPTDRDGSFEFSDVGPGRHRLGASDVAPKDGATAGRDRQWASAEVMVGSTDVTDVALTLARGASVSGRVLVERTGIATQQTKSVTGVRLFPVQGSVLLHGLEELKATLDSAGRFTIPSVPPGSYYIDVAGPDVWRGKSAMLDGRDVFDTCLDVASDIDNLAITVTDSMTQVSGHLLNATRSASAYTVIAFPASTPLPNALARRVARASGTGDTFSVTSLPAGKYLLAVIEDDEQGSWYDRKLLETLRPIGIPVTVTDGKKVVQDLRVR